LYHKTTGASISDNYEVKCFFLTTDKILFAKGLFPLGVRINSKNRVKKRAAAGMTGMALFFISETGMLV